MQHALIDEHTRVLCDWNLYPGSADTDQAPTVGQEFMDYLEKRAGSKGAGLSTRRTTLAGKEVFTVSEWHGVV